MENGEVLMPFYQSCCGQRLLCIENQVWRGNIKTKWQV